MLEHVKNSASDDRFFVRNLFAAEGDEVQECAQKVEEKLFRLRARVQPATLLHRT